MNFNLNQAILSIGGAGVVTMLVGMGGFATGANTNASYNTLMAGLIVTSSAGAAAAVAKF